MLMSNEHLLSVEDLHVSFFTYAGEVQAVRGADWHIDEHESIAIVGESGCGKTVSIQTCMGLLQRPQGKIKSGKITFRGRNVTTLSPKEWRKLQGNEMSMIFQDPLTYLNPTMRVGTQIAEIYRNHHKVSAAQAKEKVLDIMRLVSFPDPENNYKKYPHQLSGGMRQRIMVAMAVIGEPKILFADEPTTALDVTIQAQIIELMMSLRGRVDTSIVLITHDLGVVARMADRIYVMYAGRVVEHADCFTLFSQPRHPYTRALLRSIPKLTGNSDELPFIKGTPPDLISPPAGCPFAARCDHAMQICRDYMPERTDFSEKDHYAYCWLYHEQCREVNADVNE